MGKNILVIEDRHDIAKLVQLHLEELPSTVTIAPDGPTGMQKADGGAFDLIVLDLMLPGVDGLEICRRLRAKGRYTPILMVTAKSSEADRIAGLETGADDYLVKPFSIGELVARAKAILRRVDALQKSPDGADSEPVRYRELVIDPGGRRVALGERAIPLTPKEFELLYFCARHPGRVFTRTQLLESVWGAGYQGYEHNVNCHINRLRAKIEPDESAPEYIRTVWGVGYKFGD